jgi:hypothetical protein
MTDYKLYVGDVIDESLSWKELGDHWQRNVREIRNVKSGLEALLPVRDMIRDGRL